jgi:RNA polymerase sigma-70 factor (ECF subfamily)
MASLPISFPVRNLHEASILTSKYPEAEVNGSMEELYSNHRDGIYRVALRLTRNAHDAEDVVQNVFLRMMRTGKRPDLGRCATAYLRRAATNTAIDLIRMRTQRAETILPSCHPATEPRFVEKRYVRQVLDKLPRRNAMLLELHYREGYLYEELAELFGIQLGTVKSRMHNIRSAAKGAAHRRA